MHDLPVKGSYTKGGGSDVLVQFALYSALTVTSPLTSFGVRSAPRGTPLLVCTVYWLSLKPF